MRDRCAGIGEPLHVVVIDPDRVRGGEIRRDQPELEQMSDQRRSEFSRADHRLNLRFCDVHVHTDTMRACQVAAADNEGVAAMMWDGRSERGPQAVVFKRPVLNQRAAGRQACVIRRSAHRFDLRAHSRRHRVDQPRDRPVEGRVRHHRRDRSTHAHIGIGLCYGLDAFDRRRRDFRDKVVAGGATLAHHFNRANFGR